MLGGYVVAAAVVLCPCPALTPTPAAYTRHDCDRRLVHLGPQRQLVSLDLVGAATGGTPTRPHDGHQGREGAAALHPREHVQAGLRGHRRGQPDVPFHAQAGQGGLHGG